MNKIQLSGWLTDYYSQGSEGCVEWAFMNASFSNAEGWDEAGVIALEQGDDLTLLNSDGMVLWSGIIEKVESALGEVFDREGNLAPLKLVFNNRDREPYSLWMPNGIPVQDWLKWCYHKPPLRASLQR